MRKTVVALTFLGVLASSAAKAEGLLAKTITAPSRLVVSVGEWVGGIDQSIEDAVKRRVGSRIARTIEIVRLPGKMERALVVQSLKSSTVAIETRNAAVLPTIPLAAAINQAIRQYRTRAQPIPERVRLLLAGSFDARTLAEARYVVDANPGSLPGAINALRERTEANHAVVVGSIIVFAKDPGEANIAFWAHEIHHTVQYAMLGVEGFAVMYAKESAAMEAEAWLVAKRAVTLADRTLVAGRAPPPPRARPTNAR